MEWRCRSVAQWDMPADPIAFLPRHPSRLALVRMTWILGRWEGREGGGIRRTIKRAANGMYRMAHWGVGYHFPKPPARCLLHRRTCFLFPVLERIIPWWIVLVMRRG